MFFDGASCHNYGSQRFSTPCFERLRLTRKVQNPIHTSIPVEFASAIEEMGLDLNTVSMHQRHVADFLASGASRFFKITDTCRMDNGGILRFPTVPNQEPKTNQIVAFVPAAGASSRYLLPMTALMESLRNLDSAAAIKHVKDLMASGLDRCPLPESFRELIGLVMSGSQVIPEKLAEKVLLQIDAPKALYPAVTDGISFLEMKRIEHGAIGGLAGEIFVCPPSRKADFLLEAKKQPSKLPFTCYEQGPALATLRFDGSARVALNESGRPSSVPAGHGSLIRLLPSVRSDFPDARGIFIRNIDNVSGTSSEVLSETRNFLNVFKYCLKGIEEIRSALGKEKVGEAAEVSNRLLSLWGLSAEEGERSLAKVASRLFYCDSTSLKDMIAQFARPFVLMGQVPNTQRDVGGSCVFAEVDGRIQKICLELPHASPDDRKDFFENPEKATHFNPVFVAAEIPDQAVLNSWSNHPFWIIAKKSWRGRDVFYQESILYELLGSSQYCNVIFVEIPRILFNPHKTLADASNRQSDFWLAH